MPRSPTPSECSTATNEPFTECVTASEGTTVTTALLAFDNCWTAVSPIENNSPQTAQSIQKRHSAESISKCISASESSSKTSSLDTASEKTTLTTALSTSVSSDSIQLNKNHDKPSNKAGEVTSWASSFKTSFWSNWTQSGSSASSMSLEHNDEPSLQPIPLISVSSVVQSKNDSDYK
uniref:Uncharacterized protein n=1 Tax=Panagrellus redivivus TaxID=6233 RepID=A0A7E4VIG5_PANRE